MLEGIEVRLNEDYLENKEKWDALADKVVYTGPIDAYFHYEYGPLDTAASGLKRNCWTNPITRA
jgi:UDP-galactopyranose mutase